MGSLPDFKQIYRHRALEYDQLITAEDYQGNILPALQRIRPLAGLNIVELGAGTGRLTNLLAPVASQISYFDNSTHMLAVAAANLARNGHKNCMPSAGDNRAIPCRGESADLLIAGWTLGHLTGWFSTRWREEISAAVSEMKRVLRPGGTAIILETLGTGQSTPKPPNPALASYYSWLEKVHNFKSSWIRTDYRFDTFEEASRLIRFFFGKELAGEISHSDNPIVPECTGIWWLTTK